MSSWAAARVGGRRLALAALALVALALAAAGCFPAPATAQGRDIADLYAGFLVVAGVVFAIVAVPTTLAIVRFRRRAASATAPPPQTTGNLRLEIAWTAVPAVTVIGLFVATLLVLNRVDALGSIPGAELRVTAFRWGWTFEYPAEGISISGVREPGPEVVVPVGEPLRITIGAADVVHSFYVPAFLFKRDAFPDRSNTVEITIDEPGSYRGQCAEFCGLYHARMPFTIRAVARPEYEAWLAAQPGTTP